MGQRVRRQHTVSKFYLQGFANEDARIKRIDLTNGDEIVMSTADASVVRDFYSVELDDGTVSDYYEHAFAKLEGSASNALRAILGGGWPLAGEPRLALATWIALQHMRGEGTRSVIGSMKAETIRLLVGTSGKEALRHHITNSTGRSIGDEEIDLEWHDLTKPGGPQLVSDPRDHLRQIVEIVPGFAAYLADCHWTLVTFTRKALLTADHPVSLEQESDQSRGIGISTADLFSVALNRRNLLNIQPRHRLEGAPVTPDDVPDFRARGSARWALSACSSAVRHAKRYLYLHPDDAVDARIPLEASDHAYTVAPLGIEDLIDEHRPYVGRPGDPGPVTFHDAPGDESGFSLRDLEWPIAGRRYPDGWPSFAKPRTSVP
jgi:hypothetical protein